MPNKVWVELDREVAAVYAAKDGHELQRDCAAALSLDGGRGDGVGDFLKPYHWGKADHRFFPAQDDVDNNGWGVFEMGADVPILFWCASREDAEAAALRLNHLNETILINRRKHTQSPLPESEEA
jgi:hypothetical protein